MRKNSYLISWPYSTALDESKLVIGSEYETGQVHLAITHGGVTTRAWLELDRDDDGLTDQEERYFGSSRTDRDSDEDGLMDGEEAHGWGRLGTYRDIITHPAEWDTDGDGLSDGLELGMQFEDRITSFTKNVTPISSTLMDGTDFDDDDPVDGLDDVDGWRFEDANPAATTNPARPDTDLDGYWDGGDVSITHPSLGALVRMGEDLNKDGTIDSDGQNDILGPVNGFGDPIIEDDEYDPSNSASYPAYGTQQSGTIPTPTPIPRAANGTVYLFVIGGEDTDCPGGAQSKGPENTRFRYPPPEPMEIDNWGERWYHDPDVPDNQDGGHTWYVKDGLWLMGYKIYQQWYAANPNYSIPTDVDLVVQFWNETNIGEQVGDPLYAQIVQRIIPAHHADGDTPIYFAFLGHSHGGGSIANLLVNLESSGVPTVPARPSGGPNYSVIFTGYFDAIDERMNYGGLTGRAVPPEKRYPGYDIAGASPYNSVVTHPVSASEILVNYFQTYDRNLYTDRYSFIGDSVSGAHVDKNVNLISWDCAVGIGSSSGNHECTFRPYGHSNFLACDKFQQFIVISFMNWVEYYFLGIPIYDSLPPDSSCTGPFPYELETGVPLPTYTAFPPFD